MNKSTIIHDLSKCQLGVVENLEPQMALKYDAFTFPKISRRWYAKPPQGPLVGAIASWQGQLAVLELATTGSISIASAVGKFRSRSLANGNALGLAIATLLHGVLL